MKIGIEIGTVTDTNGKRGLRLWPYIVASEKQKRWLASAVTIGLFLGTLIALAYIAPDPVIEPTVTLFH